MAVDVRTSVLVHRSPGEVAAFMFDPVNDLRWTGGITSSTPAQPGPLVEGATVERSAKFLGRRFIYGYVVTRHEPDRVLELKVDRPFPMIVIPGWFSDGPRRSWSGGSAHVSLPTWNGCAPAWKPERRHVLVYARVLGRSANIRRRAWPPG